MIYNHDTAVHNYYDSLLRVKVHAKTLPIIIILGVVITMLRNSATHVETAGKGYKPPGGYMLTKCSKAH